MPHSTHQAPKLVHETDPEMVKLNCFVRSSGVVAQDGRCVEYGVGDLRLYDNSRPFGLLHLARHRHEFTPPGAARLSTLTVDVLTATG